MNHKFIWKLSVLNLMLMATSTIIGSISQKHNPNKKVFADGHLQADSTDLNYYFQYTCRPAAIFEAPQCDYTDSFLSFWSDTTEVGAHGTSDDAYTTGFADANTGLWLNSDLILVSNPD